MTNRTGRWTTDLLVLLGGTVLATVTVLSGVGGSLFRTAMVLPFILFLPGYALVSALYPGRPPAPPEYDGTVIPPDVDAGSVSWAARLGLSLAASIALLPGSVFVLYFLVGGIHATAAVVLLAALTVVLTLVALARRYRQPRDERFVVPSVSAVVGAAKSSLRVSRRTLSRPSTFEPSSRRGLYVNLALVASILVFAGSVTAMYAVPTQGEEFSELYLVTEAEDGEFVASDYPSSFSATESQPLYVAIANHEGERQPYTVVVMVQRMEQRANGTVVTDERELTRLSRTVEAGETVRLSHEPRPALDGPQLRVQYLLYRGDAPSDPSAETAYRSVHIWLSTGGQSSGGSA